MATWGRSEAGSTDLSYLIDHLSRRQKQVVLAISDMMAVPFSLWAAVAVRLETPWPDEVWSQGWWLLLLLPLLGFVIFRQMALYRVVLRSMGRDSAILIAQAVVLLSLVFIAFANFDPRLFIPRSTPIIFALILTITMLASRVLGLKILRFMQDRKSQRQPVLIYGAGESGRQLVSALNSTREYQPVAFLDDSPNLIGNVVAGHRVYDPVKLPRLLQRYNVSTVLLALPSISRKRRKEIVAMLAAHSVRVQSIPSMTELVTGIETVDHLREVGVHELLEREIVDPMADLLTSVRGRSIMVTGAGGSIGSELCRQLLTLGAARLVLFEISEPALYAIEMELRDLGEGHTIDLHPVLGSVTDEDRLSHAVERYAIQTIYHAAAYKHVPLVEANALEGIKNNVFGTLAVANVASRHEVERVILISTDKAVRPTNVMGATKRVAELILIRAQRNAPNTAFSIVRFGNVMGSSGSVIPLFASQIAAGGPVTVTHPEVIRYFMTIPEATQLVIQAGNMEREQTGADVFLLDMGEPVSILDMANRMIHLSGREVKDANNPNGDIEIIFTGLRPGEKLYEELLVSGNVMTTRHPKIVRSQDAQMENEIIDRAIAALREAVISNNVRSALNAFRSIVEGYRNQSADDSVGREKVIHEVDAPSSIVHRSLTKSLVRPS